MVKPIQPIPAERIEEAARVLKYEVDMFGSTTEMLCTGPDGSLKNAILESFAVHMRQLIEFLTCIHGGRDGEDIRAASFCEPMEAWFSNAKRLAADPTITALKTYADKKVVHLTLDRERDKVEWGFLPICELLMAELVRFARFDKATLLPACMWDDLVSIHGALPVIPPEHRIYVRPAK